MADGSRRRLWIINGGLVLLVLAVLAGTVVVLTAGSSAADATRRTVPVGRGTVAETVTATGTVASAETSTLNFSAGGKLAGVRVSLGDRVTRGQTVATLDGEAARANLTAARAQLTAARRQLSDAIDARDAPPVAATPAAPAAPAAPAPAAPATPAPAAGAAAAVPSAATHPSAAQHPWGFRRQQPTPTPTPGAGTSGAGSTGATGTGTAGSADATVASARASVRQAEAQVVTARQATEELTLVSPQDGTVVRLDAEAGQTVGGGGVVTTSTGSGTPATGASGASTGSSAAGGAAAGAASAAGAGASGAASVMTVADLDSLQVEADIPELDVGRVNTGLPATVTVNALPGEQLPGAVASVDVLPGTATGTGTAVQYGTVVDVTDPPLGLRPGMSASVSIVVAQAGDTTFVPSVALTMSGGAATATAQVLGSDGQTMQRAVGVGLTSDTTTQVTSGLAPGELVVLPDPTVANSFGPGSGPPNSAQQTRTSGR